MNKVIKLETTNNNVKNNIHMDIVSHGSKARLERVKKEKDMWVIVDAVEEPYILMRHKDITCIDAIFKFDNKGNIQLYSYTVGLKHLLKNDAMIKITVGTNVLDINCCDIIETLENNKFIKRKVRDLDIFEVKHKNEIMTIDCTQNDLMKLSIMEIK